MAAAAHFFGWKEVNLKARIAEDQIKGEEYIWKQGNPL